jgi:hypothetical protein
MIVMLSAQRKRHVLPGPPGHPPDGLVRSAGGREPVVPAARDTPGRTDRAGVVTALHLWTTIALSVDGVTGQSFFTTHPVDGICPGSHGAVGRSLCLVLNDVPSRRTGRAACLHRLSTGLCTAQLDVFRRSQKTVSTVL